MPAVEERIRYLPSSVLGSGAGAKTWSMLIILVLSFVMFN